MKRRAHKFPFSYLLLGLLLIGVASAEPAPVPTPDPLKAAEQLQARRQVLAREKAEIERSRQEFSAVSEEMARRMESLQLGQVTQAMVEQARLDAESLRLRQEDVQAEINNSERRRKDLMQSIQDLEAKEQLLKGPAKDATQRAERDQQLAYTSQLLAQQRVDLELETQHLANLQSAAELIAQHLALKERWRARLEELYGQQQEQVRREAQADLIQRLQREKQGYLDQIAELKQRLDQQGQSLSEVRRRYLEISRQNAFEQVILIDLDIRLADSNNQLSRLGSLADNSAAKSEELQEALLQLRTLQGDLRDSLSLLQRKLKLYQQQKQVIESTAELSGSDARLNAEQAAIVGKLLDNLEAHQTKVKELLQRSEEVQLRLEKSYKSSLKKDLLLRQKLPASLEQWQEFLAAVTAAPGVLLYQLRASAESAAAAIGEASPLRWLGLVAVELGLLWSMVVGKRNLKAVIVQARAREGGFTRGVITLTLIPLLRRNVLTIGSALGLLSVVWILAIKQPGFGIIMTLVLLGMAIKIPINLAWLLLASPKLPAEQRSPGVYRQWFWVLSSGGVLAAMTILARLTAMPEPVTGILDRLFMFQWLLASVPVLRLRRLLVGLLGKRYAHDYWFVSLRFLSLLVPVALLSAAVLGLVGYLNLAWTVAWHLLVFIAWALGFMTVRGVLADLVVVLKNYAVAHSNYGLLWTQDVINPLHRILGVLLFLSSWAVLFSFFGLELQSPLVVALLQFLQQPLFTLAGAEITLWRVALVVVTVLMVFWFARWCRGVTYRWVFSRITDMGVRHSLSVFTQYLIVLTGLLIALHLSGLNLTTLTVFAGALGVGIGFGLKNIADNFVSGMLLLIERPLRRGDIVKIGSNEGEITRIGIRSLSMRTWDNMEVIIPNSEVITNAFVNWTHQDMIVRTVLMIGVSYDADPHRVKAVLERILNAHTGILRDPTPLAMLWEFADSAVNFRIHYFIDVSKDSLFKIRGEVLFAIWDNFKKEGIAIPYPQRDLYIKAWPEAAAMPRSEEQGPGRMVVIGQSS